MRTEPSQPHQRASANAALIGEYSLLAVVVCAILFAICSTASARQSAKIPRIGYVSGNSPATFGIENAFRQGLRELGYVEGKNILVEYRYQEGKASRGPILVAELAKLAVDVLVVVPSPAVRAAKQVSDIPVVIVTTADPVAMGLVDSLARPGRNITGVTRITRVLNGKRLELLKEVVSPGTRMGVLFQKDSTSGQTHFNEYQTAARDLKVELRPLAVIGQKPDFEGALQTAAKERLNGIVTITNSLTNTNRKKIVDLALQLRLPSMYESSTYAEIGGLLSYSADEAEQYRRAAVYVDKILKGAKPADLPIEQPTKFELIVNLKTAKQIGINIPSIVLARTDRVIR